MSDAIVSILTHLHLLISIDYHASHVLAGVSKKLDKRVLFICSRNRLRSPTAERVFSVWPDIETDSAGLSSDAETPLDRSQIEWATLIFVMEKRHKHLLTQKFSDALRGKRVICLDIPDNYAFMQDELVELIEKKVAPYFN